MSYYLQVIFIYRINYSFDYCSRLAGKEQMVLKGWQVASGNALVGMLAVPVWPNNCIIHYRIGL